MLLSIFFVGLFFQVGAPPPGRASSELDFRRRELSLLHLGLDRTALSNLRVWDQNTSALRDARPGEVIDDSTPVMMLHLWATWCEPCKEEFPLWKDLGPRLVEQHRGRVRVAHVALQNESGDMANFIKEMPGKLPFPLKHFDRGEALAKQLRRAFPSKQVMLPMTLLLDPERVVRQAFIGAIHKRRQELEDSTARLLALVHEQEEAARRPKPKPPDEPDIFSR